MSKQIKVVEPWNQVVLDDRTRRGTRQQSTLEQDLGRSRVLKFRQIPNAKRNDKDAFVVIVQIASATYRQKDFLIVDDKPQLFKEHEPQEFAFEFDAYGRKIGARVLLKPFCRNCYKTSGKLTPLSRAQLNTKKCPECGGEVYYQQGAKDDEVNQPKITWFTGVNEPRILAEKQKVDQKVDAETAMLVRQHMLGILNDNHYQWSEVQFQGESLHRYFLSEDEKKRVLETNSNIRVGDWEQLPEPMKSFMKNEAPKIAKLLNQLTRKKELIELVPGSTTSEELQEAIEGTETEAKAK